MSGQAVQPDGTPRVVLFDFDGVLLRADAFELLVRERYAQAWWRRALVLPALPWLALQRPFSRWRPRLTLVRLALLGLREPRYRALAEAFGAQLARRPRLFCRDAITALRRHQAAGDRVIVVTGCEDALVRAVLEELGLAGLEVLASRLAPGVTGMRVARHNVGRRKCEALAAHGVTAWQRFYSDSVADIPLLKATPEPVLVNATPKACKRVEQALGRSVERVAWY